VNIGRLSSACVLAVYSVLSCNEEIVSAQKYSHERTSFSVPFSQNSTKGSLFVDPLIWTAREAGTDCWAEGITSGQSFISNNLEPVHFRWDLGFRIGARYELKHDQWDTQLVYTRFKTQGKDYASRGPGSMHSTFLGNFYVNNSEGSGITGPAYESASINWAIKVQIFDVELGRTFLIGKSVEFHPFIGAKVGSIHQCVHSKWYKPQLDEAPFFNLGIENIKNNFWGIGPEVGINSTWALFTGNHHAVSFFGDMSGALMYGHWAFGDVFNNDVSPKIIIDSQPINGGASMLRIGTGLAWNVEWGQNRYQWCTKVGYEVQCWLNQLQFYSFTGGRLGNQLTLQGVAFEFRFGF